MNKRLSIVIVCRNEAGNIEKVLESIREVSDDILVYDNGSTDGTLDILHRYGVRVHQGEWLGFGRTKQVATALARHDWILSIDADEAPDEELAAELARLDLKDEMTVYRLRFRNFLGRRHLRWGEWGGDRHIRVFHRRQVGWNDARVHESLQFPQGVKITDLRGGINHYTMQDTAEYSRKMVQYALLNAEKYHQRGKRSTRVKRYLGPPFAFVKYYLLRLGFLDGWEGLLSARMTAFYTFLKYARLRELEQEKP